MLLHAFLLSRQTFENKERGEGWWIFFSCSSNKAQDYQHIGGKIHKVPLNNTPGIWCEDVICFFGLLYLVAFILFFFSLSSNLNYKGHEEELCKTIEKNCLSALLKEKHLLHWAAYSDFHTANVEIHEL